MPHERLGRPEPTHAFSIAQWATSQGISYRTAWRMIKSNRLPENLTSEQLPSGTIRLHAEPKLSPDESNWKKQSTVIYARINTRQGRTYLESQVNLCRQFCAARGWSIVKTVKEIAPAVGKREKLSRLLANPPCRLVVLTPSIISRFDGDLLADSLRASVCQLVVVDQSRETEGTGGALEDLIDAISLTCNRHYGFKRGNLLLEALQRLVTGPQA